ncbi:hypothetical protein EPUS_02974 [Endocarpon pusillum Z07020]|uniref:Myb-like domain-containing protein n=1 Tax=Endocarpon pusillum (strain Z07020 / HMAS-L-300199) TaxID=1263415 RepID=U1GJ70_ENDPU|nr:uncharacterized protein EPUS_02974 [Endocarpon pusillum Z07020]ERF72183.1 hypothetical protein EPUS_02974 [Endocarpon pusillum Z07020]
MGSMALGEPLHSTFPNWSYRSQFLSQQMPQPQYQSREYQPLAAHQHHHHRLPIQTRHESLPPLLHSSPPGILPGTSVVGQEGMPEPASRPRGPKLKFTAQEDQMLVELKENKNLTWKQIADFFPGRTSGTLQVRYCTKLKAKTVIWTEDTVQRLRRAMEEYENDKWRLIAAKVGSGFSPTACQEKAEEMEIQEEYEDTSSPESQTAGSAPMQPYSASMFSSPAISTTAESYSTMSSRAESQPAISAPMYSFTTMGS